MGLLSLFKQKAGSTDDTATGEFRARAEDDAADAANNSANESKPRSSRKSKAPDPALPEKKRARRRLIGAATLVLTSVIGLPMLFDSEPKTNVDEISIQIPAKDKPLQGAPHSANTESQNPALASANPPTKRKGLPDESDPAEEILPATTNTENAKSPNGQANLAATAGAAGTAVAPNSATTTAVEKKPEVKTESATSQKTEPKAKELTAETKSAAANTGTTNHPVEKPKTAAENNAETARALAILDAKPSAKSEKKEPETKAGGKFTVQVAALATQEKINELQAKLKAAGIASHSQKIVTKTGEVTRIRVGPFETKQEAEKMRTKLTGLGLGGTLIPN
jgi:DedD protein